MDYLVTVQGTVTREVTVVVSGGDAETAAFEGRQDAKKLLAKGPGCILDLQIDDVRVEVTANKPANVGFGEGVETDV